VIIRRALAISALLFIGPLVGMRRRLVAEKERSSARPTGSSRRCRRASRKDLDAGDRSGAADYESAMSALGAERDRLRQGVDVAV
jgi:hypothetical protein